VLLFYSLQVDMFKEEGKHIYNRWEEKRVYKSDRKNVSYRKCSGLSLVLACHGRTQLYLIYCVY